MSKLIVSKEQAEFFKKQIYGTSKGKIRAAVVWRDLEEILTKFPNGKSLKILDVGGGFGFMAQKLAALGHNVTVVDISSDMITLGKKELENLELSGTIDFIVSIFITLRIIFAIYRKGSANKWIKLALFPTNAAYPRSLTAKV